METFDELYEALDELEAAYEEGDPDRCAAAIQPVIDAHAKCKTAALLG